MMTNEDRKKIFWLLKKYSSYTAWKALGDAFQSFADEWEIAVKKAQPPLDSDDMWVEALTKYWKGCEDFDKGIALLKQGDRYIFRNKGNWQIREILKYASRLMNADGYGEEYEHDWMVNKDAIYKAFKKIESNKEFLLICEKRDLTTSATFDSETAFWTNTMPRRLDYTQFNFPPTLPDVPSPTTKTVDSGTEAPRDGIWEPEWADSTGPKGVVTNIRNLFSSNIPTNVQRGCMNYLVAGTIAPPYQDGEKLPIMPVRWRLIWEDTRYKDGTIPPEEAEYFASPPASKKAATIDRTEGGKPCPLSGYWFTPAQINSRRHFKQDEIMPVVGSDYGSTIWQWDNNQ